MHTGLATMVYFMLNKGTCFMAFTPEESGETVADWCMTTVTGWCSFDAEH